MVEQAACGADASCGCELVGFGCKNVLRLDMPKGCAPEVHAKTSSSRFEGQVFEGPAFRAWATSSRKAHESAATGRPEVFSNAIPWCRAALERAAQPQVFPAPQRTWRGRCEPVGMATKETDAPPAQPGAHYDNPGTKPVLGPIPATDRGSVQRVVWTLFFVVLLATIAIAIALGVTGGT